jgi:hypothetical protein
MITVEKSSTAKLTIPPQQGSIKEVIQAKYLITINDLSLLELLNALYDLDPDIEKKVISKPTETIEKLAEFLPVLIGAGLIEPVTDSSDRCVVVKHHGQDKQLPLTGLGSQLVANYRENPASQTFEIIQTTNKSQALANLALISVEERQVFPVADGLTNEALDQLTTAAI